MPQILEALPHFNRFTAAYVSTNEGGSVDWRVSNRDSNITDVELNKWWVSLVQLLKVTGPAGLHFGLL